MIRRFLQKNRKASVAVEFALVTSFFLLPLTLGAADFVLIITAQAQVNTALQALYYFAWTNPLSANNQNQLQEIVSAINAASVYQVTLPATFSSGAANGSLTYSCVTPGITPTYAAATGPGQCSSTQIQQTYATYKLTTTISLPIKLPGLPSPFTLTSKGSIQIQ
ncbi:TadE/TadG family type IV pilus assembly protein [Acidocella sp.]|uniref:TadE/TadG family type IV pilus assembly protein n=1 Tax=Acidocella sp. TaxID=50710 RepID=UPI0017F7476F|nr:TadE family protein [Acidocella sp.]NNM58015.1 pilus assembly protein [Acidocella sp.]